MSAALSPDQSEETNERAYLHEGRVYLIRDVRRDGKFVRCESAVADERGNVSWKPCAEGVSFADIAPLLVVPKPDHSETLRVVRETVRQEMRAEFEARRQMGDAAVRAEMNTLADALMATRKAEAKEWVARMNDRFEERIQAGVNKANT